MGEPDVDKMLGSLSSTQISEWLGYERASGPVGDKYTNIALAQVIDLLQQLIITTAGAKDSKVQPFPRPWEMWDAATEVAESEKKQTRGEDTF